MESTLSRAGTSIAAIKKENELGAVRVGAYERWPYQGVWEAVGENCRGARGSGGIPKRSGGQCCRAIRLHMHIGCGAEGVEKQGKEPTGKVVECSKRDSRADRGSGAPIADLAEDSTGRLAR